MTDTKDDVELPERSAQNVMMSAHALCPTDMSHPERMAWMADYFMREYARQAVMMERERCIKACEAEEVDAESTSSPEDRAYNLAIEHCVSAIRKGESRG